MQKVSQYNCIYNYNNIIVYTDGHPSDFAVLKELFAFRNNISEYSIDFLHSEFLSASISIGFPSFLFLKSPLF